MRIHTRQLSEAVQKLANLSPGSSGAELDAQLRGIRRVHRLMHRQAHRGAFRRWSPKPRPDPETMSLMSAVSEQSTMGASLPDFPWTLIISVVLDSIVDSMLIGLAGAVSYM